MGKAIPAQHPAVVLRSHYALLRALLAVAMVAVVGLTIALVVVASDGDEVIGTSASTRAAESALPAYPTPMPSTRYDGGPEEGTRSTATALPQASRYDGGPEEGTRGPANPLRSDSAKAVAPASRYDGGPEEGTRGP